MDFVIKNSVCFFQALLQTPQKLSILYRLPLLMHVCFHFGLCSEVVKKPYEICMKDCEPRDWPHLPDSRANEQPHWIIPHNACGTKAQQLTLERNMETGGDWGKRVGGMQTVRAHWWSGVSLLICSSRVVAKQRLVGQE